MAPPAANTQGTWYNTRIADRSVVDTQLPVDNHPRNQREVLVAKSLSLGTTLTLPSTTQNFRQSTISNLVIFLLLKAAFGG